MIFELDSPLRMVAHLRMTGQMVYQPKQDLPLEKHTSARFWFKEGESSVLSISANSAPSIFCQKRSTIKSRGCTRLGLSLSQKSLQSRP